MTGVGESSLLCNRHPLSRRPHGHGAVHCKAQHERNALSLVIKDLIIARLRVIVE